MLPLRLHQVAVENCRPGATVTTDAFGTTVTPPRTFRPDMQDQSPSNVIAPGKPFSHVYFTTFQRPDSKILDESTVVVWVDGACKDNGTPTARAGVGVYFGPESPHNISKRIEGVQTSQRAEIQAALSALHAVKRELLDNLKVHNVVLVCDSLYVVDAMTRWVFTWQESGWKDAQGGPVVNSQDFKKLDSLIEEPAEEGIDVMFWHVSRMDNTEADNLAKRACGI
jgi:ribonuclease HI